MINSLRLETSGQKNTIENLKRQMTEHGAKLAIIEKESIEIKA